MYIIIYIIIYIITIYYYIYTYIYIRIYKDTTFNHIQSIKIGKHGNVARECFNRPLKKNLSQGNGSSHGRGKQKTIDFTAVACSSKKRYVMSTLE